MFTYERAQLFRNLIDSLHRLSSIEHIMIYDDGSKSAGKLNLLSDVNFPVLYRAGEKGTSRHGHLYENMNDALQLAANNGFDYVWFLQDDHQLVMPDYHSLRQATAILNKHAEALEAALFFHKFIDGPRHSIDRVRNAYRKEKGGLVDAGLISVTKMMSAKLQFGPTEREAGENALSKGYRTYFVRDPCLARMPWPNYFRRGREHRGRVPQTASELLLRPLDEAEQARLRERDLEAPPFHEGYVFPQGWRCLSPYVFQGGSPRWAKRMAKTLFSHGPSKLLIPRIVGEPA